MAKMTAQCAPYGSALKIFGTPDYAHGYYYHHFSWAFVSIDSMNVPKNLKSVALPVPEIIGGTTKNLGSPLPVSEIRGGS